MSQPQTTQNNAEVNQFLAYGGWITFAVIAVFAVCFVPMNMDEACTYHTLACLDYPFAYHNTFREACFAQNDLSTPFGFYIKRPFVYDGALASLLYAPIYYLFHAPQGQYAFGLIFLVAFAWLLSRATKNPKLSFPLFLAFFPLAFQFIHDTGPIKFAMLVFPLGAWLFRKTILSTGTVRYGYAFLAALLVILAVEDKSFFLYLLPAFLVFCLAMAVESPKFSALWNSLEQSGAALALIGIITATGIFCLLFSTNQQGRYYIFVLADLAENSRTFMQWLSALGIYALYWPSYAHYYYAFDASQTQIIIFQMLTLIWIIFFCAISFKIKLFTVYPKPKVLLLMLSSFLMMAVFACFRNTWAGHHFVFFWVPLLVLFADALIYFKPLSRFILVLLFLVINVVSVLALTQMPIQIKVADEKEAIFSYFNNEDIAAHSIVNFLSWGGYYIKSLYGPKTQLVTYTEPEKQDGTRIVPISPAYADQLLALSQQTGRKLYNVCYGMVCNKARLEEAFGNRVKFDEVLPGLKSWHVFVATPSSGDEASDR